MPPEIYWRRRLLVLAVAIALLWVVLQAFGGEEKSDKNVVEPTTTPAPVETTAAPAKGELSVNLTSGTAACDPEQVRVSPAVRSGQYAGSAVTVAMTVSTTGKEACVLSAKAADLLVVISANKKPVWDSSVCKTALLDKPVSVSPRWATVVQTTWSGRGSGPNCSPKEGFTSPGAYVIKSATLGGEPGQDAFRLQKKPKPKPTKATATPTKPTKSATAKPTD